MGIITEKPQRPSKPLPKPNAQQSTESVAQIVGKSQSGSPVILKQDGMNLLYSNPSKSEKTIIPVSSIDSIKTVVGHSSPLIGLAVTCFCVCVLLLLYSLLGSHGSESLIRFLAIFSGIGAFLFLVLSMVYPTTKLTIHTVSGATRIELEISDNDRDKAQTFIGRVMGSKI